jgi:hypothetical protein
MSIPSQSPKAVLRAALAVSQRALPAYAHRFSPKTYTQPQLFACLVLKAFLRTDYRGLTAWLTDYPQLRQTLGLTRVPHFTTLQKAAARLLRARHAGRLLAATVGSLYGRRRRTRRVALDSTGFSCGHASPYYVQRRRCARRRPYRAFAKLSVVIDCATHAVLACSPQQGSKSDSRQFGPLLIAARRQLRPDIVLADAGYDAEVNHRLAREGLGVRSAIPATAGRVTASPPAGRWRRLMRRRLNRDYLGYGQRWQAEAVVAMLKRRQGPAVAGRSYPSRCRDLRLCVLTHNTRILHAAGGFLQSTFMGLSASAV